MASWFVGDTGPKEEFLNSLDRGQTPDDMNRPMLYSTGTIQAIQRKHTKLYY